MKKIEKLSIDSQQGWYFLNIHGTGKTAGHAPPSQVATGAEGKVQSAGDERHCVGAPGSGLQRRRGAADSRNHRRRLEGNLMCLVLSLIFGSSFANVFLMYINFSVVTDSFCEHIFVSNFPTMFF